MEEMNRIIELIRSRYRRKKNIEKTKQQKEEITELKYYKRYQEELTKDNQEK